MGAEAWAPNAGRWPLYCGCGGDGGENEGGGGDADNDAGDEDRNGGDGMVLEALQLHELSLYVTFLPLLLPPG